MKIIIELEDDILEKIEKKAQEEGRSRKMQIQLMVKQKVREWKL